MPPSSTGIGSVLMIVPTFNERLNLSEMTSRFFATNPDCHLIVVDDSSPDGTADLCEELMRQLPRLKLMRRSGKPGLGQAYLAGIRYGLENGYDLIGTMDADLSHDPKYLPRMLERLSESDVVVGSRYIRDGGTINWRIRRILLSWLANRFAARLLKVPANDVTSGFRVYRSSALRALPLERIRSSGYSFLVELLYRLARRGCRIAEVPIIFYDRTLGASKLGRAEICRGALHLIRLRLERDAGGRRAMPVEASGTSGGDH
jgi:dolichol-phosphate mannosyltransferase